MFTVVLVIFSANILFSQSRKNTEIISKFIKKSEKIDKCMGWALDGWTGRWDSVKNDIPKRTDQNFNWFQMAKVQYKNLYYYALLFEKYDYYYKYPALQLDMYSIIHLHFFIFSADQYANIKKVVLNKEAKDYSFPSVYDSWSEMINNDSIKTDENALFILDSDFNFYSKNKIDLKNAKKFILNSQFVDGQNIVRFVFPTYDNVDLKKEYFEISQSKFQKLFIE